MLHHAGPAQRVLLVDDDVYVLQQLQRIVGLAGFETIAVSSGREALLRLKGERFDLLVTDLYMPEVDGFELLVSTRIAPHFVPAIVISGNRETTGMLNALTSLGAVHTMNKPFSTAELVDTIVAIIGTPPGLRAPGAARCIIPPEKAAKVRLGWSDAGPHRTPLHRPRILLIDDHEPALAQWRTTLRQNGFDAVFATAGETAIAMARSERYDLVFTDLQLRDMNPQDLLVELRRTRRSLPVVVACTGRESLELWTAIMELGHMTTLWKPFAAHELLAVVSAILGAGTLPRATPAPPLSA